VTATPDKSKINVFDNGIVNGSNGMTPCGGHSFPIAPVGETLAAKKAQKKEKKEHYLRNDK